MKYPYRVFQTKVGEHVFWVAESLALKGCVGQGETSEDACSELAENEDEWIATAQECDIPVPPVPIEHMTGYSGKFTVRVAAYVHREAAENAKKNGVSLTQYVNDAIVAQNARQNTIGYIFPEIKRTIDVFKSFLFDTPATLSNGSDLIVTVPELLASSKYKLGANEEARAYTM